MTFKETLKQLNTDNTTWSPCEYTEDTAKNTHNLLGYSKILSFKLDYEFASWVWLSEFYRKSFLSSGFWSIINSSWHATWYSLASSRFLEYSKNRNKDMPWFTPASRADGSKYRFSWGLSIWTASYIDEQNTNQDLQIFIIWRNGEWVLMREELEASWIFLNL